PQKLITAGLVFAGIMSSVASDAGYIVLPALGAAIFAGLGRHPLAGLAAAFAGVSGGFSANFFLSATDPMLGEITIDAAKIIDPTYAGGMNVEMNYYFIAASVFLLIIICSCLSEKIVEQILENYDGIYKVIH